MEDFIRQLAAKYELSEDIIEKIVRSEFNFVKDTMEEGSFESVHLHYFGKFACKPRHCVINYEVVQKRKKERDDIASSRLLGDNSN